MWVFYQAALNRGLNILNPGYAWTDLGNFINKVNVGPLVSGIKIIQEWLWMWDLECSASPVSVNVLQLSPSTELPQCIPVFALTPSKQRFCSIPQSVCDVLQPLASEHTCSEWEPCSFSPSPTPFSDSLSIFSTHMEGIIVMSHSLAPVAGGASQRNNENTVGSRRLCVLNFIVKISWREIWPFNLTLQLVVFHLLCVDEAFEYKTLAVKKLTFQTLVLPALKFSQQAAITFSRLFMDLLLWKMWLCHWFWKKD